MILSYAQLKGQRHLVTELSAVKSVTFFLVLAVVLEVIGSTAERRVAPLLQTFSTSYTRTGVLDLAGSEAASEKRARRYTSRSVTDFIRVGTKLYTLKKPQVALWTLHQGTPTLRERHW